jgi:hypothetical protein
MGDVAVRNPSTGELRMVPAEGVDSFVEQTGWHVASEQQKEHGAKILESGGVGQQALAAAETTVRTGTLGLVPGLAGGWQQRAEVQREEHPYIAGAAQALGALAPALATGGAGGALAGAAGLGRTGLAVAGAVGEGLAGGLAEEIEQARAETRDVSAGNILLYGLGGEIVGRALPHALAMGAGRVRRALSAVEEVAGEGVPSALAGAEARSVENEARLAFELPEGMERQAALDRTAKQQYDRLAPEMANELDALTQKASEMGDTSSSARVTERLKQTMSDESPAQQNFFTDMKERLARSRESLFAPMERTRPPTIEEYLGTVKGSKARQAAHDELTDEVVARAKKRGISFEEKPVVSLEGKRLEDIGALPIEDAADRARVEALKADPDFASTGRVKSNDGAQGITLVDDDGSLVLRDGRHRLIAAQELDRNSVYGRYVDGKTGKVIYEGEIPLKSRAKELTPMETETLASIQSEVLGEWAPPAKGLADQAGLTGHAKRITATIDNGLRRLDQATTSVDQFLIARDIKKQLQGISKKMSLDKTVSDSALHDEMRGVLDSSWREIRDGLSDESLFGGAARIERDINAAWYQKILNGLGITEGDLARKVDVDFRTGRTVVEFDPSKARSFLQGDAVDRAIGQRKLRDVLEGAEDMLAAHKTHGTWAPAEIAAQEQRILSVRQKLRMADEIQVAKGAAADQVQQLKAAKLARDKQAFIDKANQPKPETSSGFGKEQAADFVAEKVAGLLPYGGQIYRLGKRLLGIDQAARSASKQTARRLAGTAAGTLETGLGRAASVAPVPVMTALSRFTGEYSGPEESFEAKKKLLEQEQLAPEVLYETIGSALEDLPKANPVLYQQLAARTAEKVRYVRANLPPGISSTLLYPNGTPPSTSALREFATLWNTVMDPHSVLEDIDAGTATGQQMKHLRESDPDIYEQLRSDMVEEVGANFRSVPLSTKLQLDILFDADGLAGPFFSSKAGDMIGQSLKDDAARGPSGNEPDVGVDQIQTGAGPGGLTAIQNSVTNRGGGA